MKRVCSILVTVIACLARVASGDGFVLLQNRLIQPDVSWPIMKDHGGGVILPLHGPEYVAQLYAGPSPETLSAIGDVVGLGEGAEAGFFVAIASGDKLVRRIPTTNGTLPRRAWVKVVVWAYWPGIPSYEDLIKRERCYSYFPHGESQVVEVQPSETEQNPGSLSGLQSFTVNEVVSASTDAFRFVGVTNGTSLYMYYADLGGFPGVHTLEVSSNMVDWHDVASYTNTYELRIAVTNSATSGFVRMRKGCE